MNPITITRTASFAKNQAQADGNFESCIRCGKAIKRDGFMVHMTTSWQAAPADAVLDEADDQGYFPIGSECVRHLPAGYAVRS